MRKTVTEYQGKIAELTKKINSPFVEFEFFSEDKLQFVAAELQKRGIPFAEDATTLHIPEYAKEQAAAIAASYKQGQSLGIRERVKLDIDRLVYCSDSFEDFLARLKERGYTIKRGKHISVKAPFAERAVRLKSLGEAYLPKNLEQRINDRDIFAASIQEKFKSANTLEKKFHVTVTNITVAVKQFRLMPRKTDNKMIYAFQNDENINHLSRQLKTISEFNFSSREQMYSKAEELQAAGDEAKEQLGRVRELIRVYEEIVEGNYVDNLIAEQQRTQQAAEQHNKLLSTKKQNR